MTDIGNTNYKIMISTGITGSGKTNAPSGDGLYVLASEVEFSFKFDQKISRWSGGRSKGSKNGKKIQGIGVDKGVLLNTSINKATELIIMKGQEEGHAPLYAFVKLPDPDGDATPEGFKSFKDNDNTTVYHLRGYFLTAKIKPGKGKVYKMSLNYTECWT